MATFDYTARNSRGEMTMGHVESPNSQSVAAWMAHVMACAEGLLTFEVDSWMSGVNTNVEGKQRRTVARYAGSAPDYRAWADGIAAKGYRELTLA